MYLRTGDSSRTDLPDESIDLIVTDPPYMDNVHYSELADFFHAWLRELMPFARYPRKEATTRSAREVQNASPAEFEAAITRVWQECSSAQVRRPPGLHIIRRGCQVGSPSCRRSPRPASASPPCNRSRER